MDASLIVALSLVCGFSQPDCNAAQTVAIERSATVPGVASALASYDPAKRRIVISPSTDDARTAALLAHELTHVRQIDAGQQYDSRTCYGMEVEAFRAQAGMWASAHANDPAFTSPDGWAVVNATDDCRKRFG